MSLSKWDFHYSDYFFEYTQGNIEVITSYTVSQNEANEIIKWVREIEKQSFKMLYDLSKEEISVLHKTMKGIFLYKF